MFSAAGKGVISLFLVVLLCACAGKEPAPSSQGMAAGENSQLVANSSEASLDDYGSEDSLDDYDSDVQEFSDPLEPWNRFWFHFNDIMLIDIIKPVHVVYTDVVAEPIRNGLSNFYDNLLFPMRFANSLLQGEFAQAGVEFGRFFVNTVTSLGLADVAAQSQPRFPHHPEQLNFGHTLATWGVPKGPFIMLPFYGPNTLRSGTGAIADSFMTPLLFVSDPWIPTAIRSGLVFNDINQAYTPYEQFIGISFEPYIALRNAYLTLQQTKD